MRQLGEVVADIRGPFFANVAEQLIVGSGHAQRVGVNGLFDALKLRLAVLRGAAEKSAHVDEKSPVLAKTNVAGDDVGEEVRDQLLRVGESVLLDFEDFSRGPAGLILFWFCFHGCFITILA